MDFFAGLNNEFEVNSFVGYLNSLQRAGGSNENALAESQICNPYFSSIHVLHPLVDKILKELRKPDGNHVILTGHAGDGKSTIALEVLKQLKGIPTDTPLDSYPKPRENIGKFSVLKDLSERNINEDTEFVKEILRNDRRFLLVSNTGTLLDMIKGNSELFHKKEVELESLILKAISSDIGEELLTLGEASFQIFNLARMDNLLVSEQVFRKMISWDRWEKCKTNKCHETCPIYKNIQLINDNATIVVERIFLVYRRMYEYGVRLTMRQLTEHMAYTITSGLNCRDLFKENCFITELQNTRYLFTNRFFGDDGCKPDQVALEMKSIKLIKSEEFGVRQSSKWEHRLWLQNQEAGMDIKIDGIPTDFRIMQKCGAGSTPFKGITPDQARVQVRRMMFFLYKFRKDEPEYINRYLNSPTLLSWISWQSNEIIVSERKRFEKRIFHVIQEHFSGVRLPEGSTLSDSRLYITLNRRSRSIRQSARVVLAQIDWSTSTEVKLISSSNVTIESRRDLTLIGKGSLKGIDLPLKIPFLDYVILRHFGEIGEILDSSYVERLNRYKAQVYEMADKTKQDYILMIRTKADQSIGRQSLVISGGKMEVTNEL